MSKLFVSNCYKSKDGSNYFICGYVLTSDGVQWRGSGKNNFPYRFPVSEDYFNQCKSKISNGLFLDVEIAGLDAYGSVLFRLKR